MDRFELRMADFTIDDELSAVSESFGSFFARFSPTTVARAAEPLGFDAELWRRLVDTGAIAMGGPASLGGGATMPQLCSVAREVGRAVAPVPFVSQSVCARLLAAVGSPVLGAAIAGEAIVALAFRPDELGPQLVPDGAIASHVVAMSGDDLVLHSVAAPLPHLPNQGSTPLARWSKDAAAATEVLATGAEARRLFDTALAEWQLLSSAALLGLTEASLSVSVEFVKTRTTMGVPIGALQGVAFPLADVETDVAALANLLSRAAWLHDDGDRSQPELPAATFAYASQVATRGTSVSAHMQGGLGFTIEADASLYFLRAKGWSVLGGDPQRHFTAVGKALVARVTAAR